MAYTHFQARLIVGVTGIEYRMTPNHIALDIDERDVQTLLDKSPGIGYPVTDQNRRMMQGFRARTGRKL